jgi:hypothetical protein
VRHRGPTPFGGWIGLLLVLLLLVGAYSAARALYTTFGGLAATSRNDP